MKSIAFAKASESERLAFAVNLTTSLKEFVAQGNSVTLSQRLVIKKHNTNRYVLKACCQMMKVGFEHLKGRHCKIHNYGLDVLP